MKTTEPDKIVSNTIGIRMIAERFDSKYSLSIYVEGIEQDFRMSEGEKIIWVPLSEAKRRIEEFESMVKCLNLDFVGRQVRNLFKNAS